MATKEEKNVTGLDMVPANERKDAEYDLVKALLEASSFKTSEDEITTVEIKRSGKFLFEVRIRPLSDADVKQARKQAGIYKPNPTNKKLGSVKVDTDDAKFGSWLIYLATVDEDKNKIWGNQAIMSKFGLMQPWESVDVLLKTGEKADLLETVFKISGLDDDDESSDEEIYAKN